MPFTEDSDPIEDLEIGFNVRERKFLRDLLNNDHVVISSIQVTQENIDVTTCYDGLYPNIIKGPTRIRVEILKY